MVGLLHWKMTTVAQTMRVSLGLSTGSFSLFWVASSTPPQSCVINVTASDVATRIIFCRAAIARIITTRRGNIAKARNDT